MNPSTRLTAVIADDEPLALAWLRNALAAENVEVIGEAATGSEGVRLCGERSPDVFFTDIRMPSQSGLDATAAIAELARPPLVVFISGYAEHAPAAFELAAADYLLKPVSSERLAASLARIRRTLETTRAFEAGSAELSPLTGRLPVRVDYSIQLVRVLDIEAAIAGDKRVVIWANGEGVKSYYTLTRLQRLLPADRFFRTHASAIVQIERVEAINLLGDHTYSVRMSSGLIVPVGRAQYPDLQRLLGMG